VGVALRNLAQCPIELNLMPKSSLKRQALAQKQPYFIAGLVSLVLVAFAVGWFSYRVTADKQEALTQITRMLAQPEKRKADLDGALKTVKASKADVDQLTGWLQSKIYWNELMTQLRQDFMATEELTKKKRGVDAGVWIESFSAGSASASNLGENQEEFPPVVMTDPRMADRYKGYLQNSSVGSSGARGSVLGATNEPSVVKLTCRARNLMHVSPEANTDLMYDLESRLQSNTNFFSVGGTNGTHLVGILPLVTISNFTFSFQVQLRLKQTL
jgi:type IV pilus assembly protein PilM